jgi:hypothetical protein
MNNDSALVAAIRGPILLITLGAIVSVDHFGGYSIGRTWPLLLIVFGLLKLFERMLGQTPGTGGGASS